VVIQQARNQGLPVRELKADRDKVSRALVASARMEGGQVYFPAARGWLDEWESELLLFPNGRHDDQAGTLAYAVLEVTTGRSTRVDLSGWNVSDLVAPSWLPV
jgi:predicted phage terminase large subunit-like protein